MRCDFELLVPTSSATRQKFGVLIQAQLASIGVTVDLTPLEQGMFVSAIRERRLRCGTEHVAHRSESGCRSLRQVWETPHGKDIGANYGRYSNKSVRCRRSTARPLNSTPVQTAGAVSSRVPTDCG